MFLFVLLFFYYTVQHQQADDFGRWIHGVLSNGDGACVVVAGSYIMRWSLWLAVTSCDGACGWQLHHVMKLVAGSYIMRWSLWLAVTPCDGASGWQLHHVMEFVAGSYIM